MSRNARPESAAPWSRFALGALPWVAPLALLEAFVWSIREAASWPIVHDVPLMVYAGFLMQEHGLVPYRDFFEMNPPGTLSFNAAYYELFGASPAAFRVAHLSWLAAVLAGIVAFGRRWHVAAGVTAAMCFAVAYVGTGRDSAFQRESLLILPLIGSLLVAFPLGASRSARGTAVRSGLIGLLFGAAASVKPPIALGLPPLWVGFVIASSRANERDGGALPPLRSAAALAGWAALGFAAVPAVLGSWLASAGALGPFLEMATHYWPLYREIAGDGRVLTAGMHEFAAPQTLARVREFPYLPAALAGVVVCATARARRDRPHTAALAVVLCWALCWSLYIYFGGKTWYYHAHPLYLTLSLLAGLSVLWLDAAGPLPRPLPRGVVAAALFALLWLPAPRQSKPLDLLAVDAISDRVCPALQTGDRVLPVDVASGALHVMLRCQARVAGSFLYAFHFMHHTDTPYIRGLRSKWLEEIRVERPRFVIRATSGWRIEDADGPTRFPELDRWLARHYATVPLPVRGQLELLELRQP